MNSPTVLLVDDDEMLRAALARSWRREPLRLLTAGCAADALATLQAGRVDVVISDEAMPGMNGTELLRRVRAEYPEVVSILLTGYGSFEVAKHAINTGEVFRILAKPCDPAELALTVYQAVEYRRLIRDARRLLHTSRRQAAALASLGVPCLSAQSAAIELEDEPIDLPALLAEVEAHLAAAGLPML